MIDNSSWKKYCIETCYGFWAARNSFDGIEEVKNEKYIARAPYYESLFKIIVDYEEIILKKFKSIAKDIEQYVEEKKLIDENGEIIQWSSVECIRAWGIWYKRLVEKLNMLEFRNRIIIGIISAPVPNVWSDKLSAKEFEESFVENLHYYCIKGQVSKQKHAATKFIEKYLVDKHEFTCVSSIADQVEMVNKAIEYSMKGSQSL